MYIHECQQTAREFMQLTKHTDYAFRVLIYLASMHQPRTTIKEITETFDISKTHVMKVVNELANKGWVSAIRGKNGGITLGVDAKAINLRSVVELMEKTLNPISCTEPLCYIKGICKLKPILMQAQDEYLTHLSNYTVADLMNDQISQKIAGSEITLVK